MPDAPRLGLLPRLVGLALLLVLFLGVPIASDAPPFSRGYMLRNVGLPLVSSMLLLLLLWRPQQALRLPPPRALLLALPLLVALLGLLTRTGLPAARFNALAMPWLALVGLPLAIGGLWRTERAAAATLRTVCWAAPVLALMAVIDALRGYPAVAGFGRPGIAGPMLAALVAPAWLLLPRRRGIHALASGLLVVGVALTGSRTALLGLVLGVGSALAVALADPRARRRARLGLVLAFTLIVIGIGAHLQGALPLPGGQETARVRLGLFQGATRLTAEAPLTGHGLGSYPSGALRVRDRDEARLEAGRRPEHAHNDPVQAMAEGGLFAGLALIAWWVGLLVLAVQRSRRLEDEPTRRTHAAMLAIFATIAAASLLEGALRDPGPVLLMSLPVAWLVCLPARAGQAARLSYVLKVPVVLLATGLLATATVHARLAIVDHAFVEMRRELRAPASIEAGTAARETYIARVGAWGEDHPEAWYWLGVQWAREGDLTTARRAWRNAIRLDPGMTEARMDLARTLAMDGRHDDAETVLREAIRRDPRRFDLRIRYGHLGLGPEPVPGDPPELEIDRTEALRRYNAARAEAPGRFENLVAEARLIRRTAETPEELAAADALLLEAAGVEEAEALLPALTEAPAELVLEAARLAEAMGRPDTAVAALLALAISRDLRVAGTLEKEAERFLEEGQRREDAERERAEQVVRQAGGLPRFDWTPALRAYRAGATRLSALLMLDQISPTRQIEVARALTDARRYRQAVARFEAVLAWLARDDVDQAFANARAAERLRAATYIDGAKAARNVDGDRARGWYARGYTLHAELALVRGDLEGAEVYLSRAEEHAPNDLEMRYALARLRARQVRDDEAAKALLEVLSADGRYRARATAERDFGRLRERPDIRAALR